MSKEPNEIVVPIMMDRYTGGFTIGKPEELPDKGFGYCHFLKEDDNSYKISGYSRDGVLLPPSLTRSASGGGNIPLSSCSSFTYDQIIGDYTDSVLGTKNIPEVGEPLKAKMEEEQKQREEQERKDKELLAQALKNISEEELRVLRNYFYDGDWY
jgi:hypothetical protein